MKGDGACSVLDAENKSRILLKSVRFAGGKQLFIFSRRQRDFRQPLRLQ
jgi:hypothetical protein